MVNNMQHYFSEIVKELSTHLAADERFTAWFSGEVMDFARFSKNLIRQAGTIQQQFMSVDVSRGQKHSVFTIGLTKNISQDRSLLLASLKRAQKNLDDVKEDPYFSFNEQVTNTTDISENRLQPKEEIVEDILRSALGLDHVGIYFGGPIFKGFANSLGQQNWFEKSSFVIDTSVYAHKDQAVKQSYSGDRFDNALYRQKIALAKQGLTLFEKPAESLKPGRYKVYFSPSAVYEILSLINWQGFSRKMLEVKNSPLLPLAEGKKKLSPHFSLTENFENAVGPRFQEQGYIRPKTLSIIEKGHLKNTLISPSTGKEYKIAHTGANEGESMCSMDMASGTLDNDDITRVLHDGLYINNLWYLNWSDPVKGVITGMTRFLCYRVQNGQPLRSFGVLRFDESIYRIFGDGLLYLTKNREHIIDNSTYEERSTSQAILPGIIVEDVRFTL